MTYVSGILFAVILLIQAAAAVAQGSDEYIAGYVAALVEHELHLPGAEIQVDRGVVTVYVKSLGAEDPEKIAAAVKNIPGGGGCARAGRRAGAA